MADSQPPLRSRSSTNTTPSSSNPTTTTMPVRDRDKPKDKDLPNLASTAPAIFVPLTEDLTAPLPALTTRSAKLRLMISRLDTHSAAVSANFQSLFTRERTRITRIGTAQETALSAGPSRPPEIPPGGGPLSDADRHAMLNNMLAPQDPALDYNITKVPPAVLSSAGARNPREFTSLEVLRLTDVGAAEIEAYERHVAQIRARYEKLLEKALREEAE